MNDKTLNLILLFCIVILLVTMSNDRKYYYCGTDEEDGIKVCFATKYQYDLFSGGMMLLSSIKE